MIFLYVIIHTFFILYYKKTYIFYISILLISNKIFYMHKKQLNIIFILIYL